MIDPVLEVLDLSRRQRQRLRHGRGGRRRRARCTSSARRRDGVSCGRWLRLRRRTAAADLFVAKFSAAGRWSFRPSSAAAARQHRCLCRRRRGERVCRRQHQAGDVPTTRGRVPDREEQRRHRRLQIVECRKRARLLDVSRQRGRARSDLDRRRRRRRVGLRRGRHEQRGFSDHRWRLGSQLQQSRRRLRDQVQSRGVRPSVSRRFSEARTRTRFAVSPCTHRDESTSPAPTLSCDYPVTGSAADTSCNGGSDAFITVVEPTGAQLAISTYLGGSATDVGWDIVAGANGEATVAGYTTSPNLPAAVNSPLGGADGYVARLRPGGAVWDFVSYVGGSGDDYA